MKFRTFKTLALALAVLIGCQTGLTARPEEADSQKTQSGKVKKDVLAPAQDIKVPEIKTEAGSEAAGQKASEPVVIDFTKRKKVEESKDNSISPALDKKLEDLAKQQADAKEKAEIEEASQKAGEKAGTEPEKSGGSFKLFGRIEQISKSDDVKMPTLKALTPRMDPRGIKLKEKVDENHYSGNIAKFFPSDFAGTWGGTLQVWSYHWSPRYLKFDRKEAIQTAKILKKGRKGNVNFVFYRNSRGRSSLKPAEVLLSIPMKDSYTYRKMMNASNTQQMAPFDKSFENVMANMEVPMVKINFGNFQTDGVMMTGVSGNKAKQTVVKNVIRQLAPEILEQQIITRAVTQVKGTNKTNTGYAESVLRFKKLGHGKMYVLAASVNYTSKGEYLDKLIMYGNVYQGKLVQTNPMGNLTQMMGNMMNLQNMFGMPSSGQGTQRRNSASPFQIPGSGGQIQGMPKGFDPYKIIKQMQQGQK